MSTIVSGGGSGGAGGGGGHAAPGGRGGHPSAGGAASLGPYMAREAFLSKAEADGDLAFAYLAHEGAPSPATALWLVGLKGVYARQLPNMPREYIARLVFDPTHRSVAIVRRGGAVVGGITYRAFPAPSLLGEVAFCAVMAAEQVKGFGTRLMNHCKAAARDRDGLGALLTYADNNAVGYFAKQGFTKEISLPRERVRREKENGKERGGGGSPPQPASLPLSHTPRAHLTPPSCLSLSSPSLSVGRIH